MMVFACSPYTSEAGAGWSSAYSLAQQYSQFKASVRPRMIKQHTSKQLLKSQSGCSLRNCPQQQRFHRLCSFSFTDHWVPASQGDHVYETEEACACEILWECVCWPERAMSKTPEPQTHRGMLKPFPWGEEHRKMVKTASAGWVWVLTVWAEHIYYSFLPVRCLRPEDCSLTEQEQPNLASWSKDLLVYLEAITLFPLSSCMLLLPCCSTLYNKHSELPECCSFFAEGLDHRNPSFLSCFSLCLSLLHSLAAPVMSFPGDMQDVPVTCNLFSL